MVAATDTPLLRASRAQEALMTEPWVSVNDIAFQLGVTMDSVHRWMDSKGLPAHKPGKLWKVKLSRIDESVRGGGANDQAAKRLPPARKGKPGRKR